MLARCHGVGPFGRGYVLIRGCQRELKCMILAGCLAHGKGSALLNLQEGSQALVKSHSRVVLKSLDTGIGSYLKLLLGKLIAKVQKRIGEAPLFRMGTPSAVITVRGTHFEVEITKKKRAYVQVFEGVVEYVVS